MVMSGESVSICCRVNSFAARLCRTSVPLAVSPTGLAPRISRAGSRFASGRTMPSTGRWTTKVPTRLFPWHAHSRHYGVYADVEGTNVLSDLTWPSHYEIQGNGQRRGTSRRDAERLGANRTATTRSRNLGDFDFTRALVKN